MPAVQWGRPAFGAIGTSPFGIDELLEHERDGLRDFYGQIRAVTDDILDAQAVGTIHGFVVQHGQDEQFELGQYRFSVSTDRNFCEVPGFQEQGHGILLALSPDEFLTLGRGFALRVETVDGRPTVLHSVQELALDEPTGRARDLPVLRWLNGDETLSGFMVRVTGEVVSAFPGDLPASPSITGVIRFSVFAPPK